MPTKKSSKSKKETNVLDFQNFMDNPDSYKNLIYGIITVVVLFVVLFLGLRTLSRNQSNVTDNAVNTSTQESRTHVVEEGETLWSIAEKEYGDGFKWELIADANKITNASSIEKGTKLTIPAAETKVSPTAMESKPSVSPSEVMPTATPTSAPTATMTQVVTNAVTPTTKVVVSPSPTVAMARPTETVPANKRIAGTNYKVAEGDYLWDIAVRAYGDGYRWVEIANENKIANPDLIYPGDQLKLKRP